MANIKLVSKSRSSTALPFMNPHEVARLEVSSGRSKWATVHESGQYVIEQAQGTLVPLAGKEPDTTYVKEAPMADKFPQDIVVIAQRGDVGTGDVGTGEVYKRPPERAFVKSRERRIYHL